ncbi:MAG: NUDIX domain-containing protein [Anaerolineales bacterium]
MPKKSAGILVYRKRESPPEIFLEVFLVHPGGPFWAKKDAGAWTIPKGEFDLEDALAAAQREFKEETGFDIAGDFKPLAPQTLKSGKVVYAWAVEGDLDAAQVRSNLFEVEWPPRSGRRMQVPEVDRGGWFSVEDALKKINPAQAGFIRELAQFLGIPLE